ncbi:MAG: dTDP-4-dehydrorhamnose 3,5-epimerase [Bdellovibrio sp.]|nr:dTDP-4-dehydrorhamnose 3,5-epimerase [Bdellovibrio sp.]
MKISATGLNDCFILEPKVHGDQRGFFLESFNQKVFDEATQSNFKFVQDNHSKSKKGVLRGLHYQVNQPQGKLVRVLRGEVFDVAVDLRKSSSTFGKTFGLTLNEHEKKLFWIPPGFAHGFIVLSDEAEFFYKTTDYYAPHAEKCIIWDDPDLKIDWKLSQIPILSDKDLKGELFQNCAVFD